ncbi:rhomboid protease ROM4 [Babesia ovata]|uniref:Rhomboid-like protease n=1 Tax=Babesia ovata TaxID=189622 RepID=A0A2H6KCH3_9APIC|nr:rhomboid protease ROM4 [Babesia ovata]GBE60700.1 rhomboid protease ROM4 [Babesia ovata]
MANSGRDGKSDDGNSSPGSKKKSFVKSMVKGGIFGGGRSRAQTTDAQQKSDGQQAESAPRHTAPADAREEQQKRARFLAEKYEKIIAARTSAESTVARATQSSSSASAAAAAASRATSTSQAAEAPKASVTSKASDAPKASETGKVSVTSKASDAPKASETGKVSVTSKASDAPKVSETGKVSVASKVSEAPKTSKSSDAPKTSESAKVSVTPTASPAPQPAPSTVQTPASQTNAEKTSASSGARVRTLADLQREDEDQGGHPLGPHAPRVRFQSSADEDVSTTRGGGFFGRRVMCPVRREVRGRLFPGRLFMMLSSTILMTVLFIYQAYLNMSTFNGRCVGGVDYTHKIKDRAIFNPIGYAACENNLKTKAADRYTIGTGATDEGYPRDFVHNGADGWSMAPPDGPNPRIIYLFGAMSPNHIRLYKESYRLWTSIFLHSGYFHLLNNMVTNILFLYILEPDWGFLRCLFAYLFCGYAANLVHASMSPCYATVGASGALFALCGALIPYAVEQWDKLRSPIAIIIISVVLFLFDVLIPKKGVSSHAHFGGYLFGICYGFATMETALLLDRGALFHRFVLNCFGRNMSEEKQQQYREKIARGARASELARIKYEQTARDRVDRFRWLKKFLGVYPLGPYRMRLRDIIIRVVFFLIMIAMFIYFYMATYYESVYSKLSPQTNALFSRHCYCGFLKKEPEEDLLRYQIGGLGGQFYCFPGVKSRIAFCDPGDGIDD